MSPQGQRKQFSSLFEVSTDLAIYLIKDKLFPCSVIVKGSAAKLRITVKKAI